ncbi:hypothetical protein AAE478_010052 [Parahypoxylon ruwenzoriense]
MSALRSTGSATSATSAVSSATRGSFWLSQLVWGQALSRMTGTYRRRYPRLELPPSRVLALRLRSKTDKQKRAYAHAFEYAVMQRSARLPLLIFQAWMARQDIQNEPSILKSVRSISSSEWSDRFRGLAFRGWSREDLDHWIWILSGENGDVRVERLVSTDSPKPIFFILLLARSDERFRKAESILSLMEYTSKHYFHSKPQLPDNQIAPPIRKMTMPVPQFLVLLRRLILHVQRVWPMSIVTVARFTADYIRGIPDTGADGYRYKCRVFNTALRLFKRPAAVHPFVNREYNWRAQKLLLAMSDNLDKPLVINRRSYRSVREVMIGLKKSKTEKAVSMRYAKSWPAYRQELDGLDTKRTAEDDYSRSVKAGLLMKEAGYPEDDYDQALSALGGKGTDFPTIQTLSLPPKEWTGKDQDNNVYSRWAMMVRATRNSWEAWRVFNRLASETGQAPNVQVYAEMFIKLQARPLSPNSDALPGDSRETFPVHYANYSEYELSRLSPPTVSELYEQMISCGLRPEGHCLNTLLMNASSLEEAYRYLRDSGLDSTIVGSLSLHKSPSYQTLRQVPLLVFKSYIQLLCRLQPNRQGQESIESGELLHIRHAIHLSKLRLRPETTEGSTFRPPWSAIMRALARPHICVINNTSANNDIEALSMCLDVLQSVQMRVGADPEIFLYLCRAIQKVAVSQLRSLQSSSSHGDIGVASLLVPSAKDVLQTIKAVFSQVTETIRAAENESWNFDVPVLVHNIGPAHLHAYMRTLAFLEDTTAMKELFQWVLTHRRYINEEAERRGNRGHALIAKTLCAFHAFAGHSFGHGELEKMISQMEDSAEAGGSWRWPTPDEVKNYVGSDQRGGSQQLQQRILAKSWFESYQQESREAMAAGSV